MAVIEAEKLLCSVSQDWSHSGDVLSTTSQYPLHFPCGKTRKHTWLKHDSMISSHYSKWKYLCSLQNSSAPSAEDVDPEVHVLSFPTLSIKVHGCKAYMLTLMSHYSSSHVTWTEHTGRRNRKRLARVPHLQPLLLCHWLNPFRQSVNPSKVTFLSSQSA